MRKITIQSMAYELGLSRNTVSMALKGNKLVSPETRERVLRYARTNGYCKLTDEQKIDNLYQKTVNHIMILKRRDAAVFWDKVIGGITEEASQNGCQVHVSIISAEDEETFQLPLGFSDTIKAVLCVSLFSEDYIRKIKETGTMVVMLDSYKKLEKKEPLGDFIKSEGYDAVASLTKHLLEQGMSKICYVGENINYCETMYDRYAGFMYAMEQAGIQVNEEQIISDLHTHNYYSEENFDDIINNLPQIPEAFVCGNDSNARFVTQALRKRGLRVPEDVAITGFDNDEEGMLDPFFTTVHVDAKWIGRRMVQCFLWRLQHPNAPYEKIIVSGEVIFRSSSKK